MLIAPWFRMVLIWDQFCYGKQGLNGLVLKAMVSNILAFYNKLLIYQWDECKYRVDNKKELHKNDEGMHQKMKLT